MVSLTKFSLENPQKLTSPRSILACETYGISPSQLLKSPKNANDALYAKKRQQWYDAVLKIYEELVRQEGQDPGNASAGIDAPTHEYLRLKRQQNNAKFKEILNQEKEQIARMILHEINAKSEESGNSHQRIMLKSMDASLIQSQISKKALKAQQIRERHAQILREKQERLQRKRREVEVRNEQIRRRKKDEEEQKRLSLEQKDTKKDQHIQTLQRMKEKEMREKHERHLMKTEEAIIEAERIARQRQFKRDQIEQVRRIKEEKVQKFLEEKEQFEKEAKKLMAERKTQRFLLRQALERIQKSPNEAPPSWISSDLERMKQQGEDSHTASSTAPVLLEASSTAALDHRIRSSRNQKLSPLRRESMLTTDGSMSVSSPGDMPRNKTSLGHYENERKRKKLLRLPQEKADKILNLPYWDTRPKDVIKKRKQVLQNSITNQHERTNGHDADDELFMDGAEQNGSTEHHNMANDADDELLLNGDESAEPYHRELQNGHSAHPSAKPAAQEKPTQKKTQAAAKPAQPRKQTQQQATKTKPTPSPTQQQQQPKKAASKTKLSPSKQKSQEAAISKPAPTAQAPKKSISKPAVQTKPSEDATNFDDDFDLNDDDLDMDMDVTENDDETKPAQDATYDDDDSFDLDADDDELTGFAPQESNNVNGDAADDDDDSFDLDTHDTEVINKEVAAEDKKPTRKSVGEQLVPAKTTSKVDSPPATADSKEQDETFNLDDEDFDFDVDTTQSAAKVEQPANEPASEDAAAKGASPITANDDMSDFKDDSLDLDLNAVTSDKKAKDNDAFDAEMEAMMNDFENDEEEDGEVTLDVDDNIDEWLNM